jgi:hypothetical protein
MDLVNGTTIILQYITTLLICYHCLLILLDDSFNFNERKFIYYNDSTGEFGISDTKKEDYYIEIGNDKQTRILKGTIGRVLYFKSRLTKKISINCDKMFIDPGMNKIFNEYLHDAIAN